MAFLVYIHSSAKPCLVERKVEHEGQWAFLFKTFLLSSLFSFCTTMFIPIHIRIHCCTYIYRHAQRRVRRIFTVWVQPYVHVEQCHIFPCSYGSICFSTNIFHIVAWLWATLCNMLSSTIGTYFRRWPRAYTVQLKFQVGNFCEFIWLIFISKRERSKFWEKMEIYEPGLFLHSSIAEA